MRRRKVLCWLLGHDWDEDFVREIQELAASVQPLYVAGGGMLTPCKRCHRWRR